MRKVGGNNKILSIRQAAERLAAIRIPISVLEDVSRMIVDGFSETDKHNKTIGDLKNFLKDEDDSLANNIRDKLGHRRIFQNLSPDNSCHKPNNEEISRYEHLLKTLKTLETVKEAVAKFKELKKQNNGEDAVRVGGDGEVEKIAHAGMIVLASPVYIITCSLVMLLKIGYVTVNVIGICAGSLIHMQNPVKIYREELAFNKLARMGYAS